MWWFEAVHMLVCEAGLCLGGLCRPCNFASCDLLLRLDSDVRSRSLWAVGPLCAIWNQA